ncbi:hypothetical protein [Burkholderia pseudomallei]|nr:hypothetical protein [Burkholderia pseudomallei]KIX39424.1 hypothetical protein SZ28_12370 [Burkholderia pseudomallei]
MQRVGRRCAADIAAQAIAAVNAAQVVSALERRDRRRLTAVVGNAPLPPSAADMPRKTRTARAARRRTGRSDSRTLDERAPCSAHARNALRTRWRGDSARA